jgi:hypothetical protein
MFQTGAFFRTILVIWSRARSIYPNVKNTFMNASFHQEMRFGPIKLVKQLNPHPNFDWSFYAKLGKWAVIYIYIYTHNILP